MSMLNDDGIPLNLTTVLLFFLLPNLTFIILTVFIPCLVHLSKQHSKLSHVLGEIANFFSKGALDRIIRNMLQHFEIKKLQPQRQMSMNQQTSLSMSKRSSTQKKSSTTTFDFTFEKQYDTNYLLLIPFQIDLLLTVFVYKILTRDVYPETCESYLTTYHNRPTQVVCWLKHTNKNISNLSTNITLYQYCTNQTITYYNYEHSDVICTHYVFRLINIIDTVTNIFAWHQAIVFIVTKSILFSYWYQNKLRKTSFWSNLFTCQRHSILFFGSCSITILYILFFILLVPIWFYLFEGRRVDLTHHLIYACAKFIVGMIVHVNLYTLYQWYSLTMQTYPVLTITPEFFDHDQSPDQKLSVGGSEYHSPSHTIIIDDSSGIASKRFLTPESSL